MASPLLRSTSLTLLSISLRSIAACSSNSTSKSTSPIDSSRPLAALSLRASLRFVQKASVPRPFSRKLRAIYENDRKSDELDARMLARLARVDPELLHPIEHVSEQSQRDLARVKLRDNLVRQRVDVINSVRFILKSMGIRLPSPNTNCFAKRARTLLEGKEPELLAAIEPSLQVIDTMTAKIRELDREIERLCEQEYPETRRLRQIRGIGPI